MRPLSPKGIIWKRQGAAVIGAITYQDGRFGNVVLVGGVRNSKGAALVLPATNDDGKPQTMLLQAGSTLLHPMQLVEILCMQERIFGDRGLVAPEALKQAE